MVDRTDNDLPSHVALGVLRRPAPLPLRLVGLVVPDDLEAGQDVGPPIIGLHIARQRQHDAWPDFGREQAFGPPFGSGLDLARRAAGGQGEIEPVDAPGLEQPLEVQECRLGLARAGLGLKDDELRWRD